MTLNLCGRAKQKAHGPMAMLSEKRAPAPLELILRFKL